MLEVLILDDERMVLEMLSVYLDGSGIRLTTCQEIEAAEALLSCRRFDVLVTDLTVSRLGGLEGMRLIRFVTTHFPDTAVYVLSGNVNEEVRALSEMLGVAAVLEKPSGLDRLRHLLDARRASLFPGSGDTAGGGVQHVEPLEDFLAVGTISSVLQPVVRLESGARRFEVYGVEGLARGPEDSLLGDPAVLLRYASRKELLFEVDMICIRAALAEASVLGVPLNIFLNVQPRSMTNPDFTRKLREAVRTVGQEPGNIVLELTEQQTIVNPGAFGAALAQLRQEGFRIALDDFGEGSSNLNLFKDLRPEFLKLSGSFSQGLARDPLKQIIVQSTAEMAHRAGTVTIMESVETEEDAEMLCQLGIDYGQGYYFSHPAPARELVRSARLGALQQRRG